MVSGRGRKSSSTAPSREQLIRLYTKIYEWNIMHGVQTLAQIREEGISPYAGSRPCSLPASGLYVSYYGDVYMSEGNDGAEFNYGNVRHKPLKEIWEQSRNFKEFAGKANCGCPAKDGITIPKDLYRTVLDNLTKKFS
jgi:MoaA/NifB/PqqE/SkfB family radical SAM enzyme